MKSVAIRLVGFLSVLACTVPAPGQNAAVGETGAIEGVDPSGARRFLADSGELVTLYGSRRFDPYYEPGRPAPPTDSATGWPIDWSMGAYLPVGGVYSPYAFSPYGSGFYRSYYRPSYVPYSYGYGWGYRNPFAYNPWRAYAYNYYRPSYAYGPDWPWYADRGYGWHSPYVDHGASFLNEGAVFSPHAEYGGCFFW